MDLTLLFVCALFLFPVSINGEKQSRLLLNDPMHLEVEIQQLKMAVQDSKSEIASMKTTIGEIASLKIAKDEIASLKTTIGTLQTQISAMQNAQGT